MTTANAITSKKWSAVLTFICLFLWRVSQVVERTLDLSVAGGGSEGVTPEGSRKMSASAGERGWWR